MPISKRKMEANRRNARKSTGARTKAGKNKSRWNALKYGLTAKRTLLPGLENAKSDRRLATGYLRDFKPKGTFEKLLVRELAACRLQKFGGVRAERTEFLPAGEADNDDECLD